VLFENVLGAGGQALGAHVWVIGSSGTDPRLTAAWLRVTTVVERTLACLREDQRWEQQQRVQQPMQQRHPHGHNNFDVFFDRPAGHHHYHYTA